MVILAAVDGDERPDPVVTVAGDLADAYGDELIVAHVMPEAEFERRRDEREYYVDQAADDASKTARWVVSGTPAEDADPTLVGRMGEPAEEILDLAAEREARYVVVGGRKRSPAGKVIFGSVTQSVLLNADRPIVTVLDGGE